MISPLLGSGVQVGRLCWVGQGAVVLAAEGRPTNLDSGRARAYCVCSRLRHIFFSRRSFFFSFSLSLGWMVGWPGILRPFQQNVLNQDDGWVIDDCEQCNQVYD